MIQHWSPEHSAGAISVVRAVFDEYGFTWDPDGYHADLYDVPAFYLKDGLPFFVAVSGGVVVGTAALDLFPALSGPEGTVVTIDGKSRIAGSDCALERLYVHPDARRRGLGSSLFQRVIEEANTSGRRRMEIWSDKRFEGAHRLYQRFGARVVGDRICDDPDESPEWGLTLALREGQRFIGS